MLLQHIQNMFLDQDQHLLLEERSMIYIPVIGASNVTPMPAIFSPDRSHDEA